MDNQVHNQIVSFIWGIADDCLRDVYVRGKYRDVILPMTVIRRLDAMLEETKRAVLDMKKKLDTAGVDNQWLALSGIAGQAFCNASPFLLRDLTNRAKKQTLKADFEAYLDGFSPNVQEILERFAFKDQIKTLVEADVLTAVIEKFVSPDINLSPNPVYRDAEKTILKHPGLDNHGMGTIFEELVRRFNEANNEEAGEHWTPRDVVELMADLVLVPVAGQIKDATYSCYDGACGTGGMLTVAQDRLTALAGQYGKRVSIHLFGQESQGETYAICKADMLLKGDGEQAEHICYGSTLSADGNAERQFDFMLSNPPYGKSWKVDAEKMGGKKEILDTRFNVTLSGGETLSMIPRTSDGQLLFLLNNVAKMKRDAPLGSRIAEVHNGSSIFTGDAGSGESNARRYLIESDLVEAIIALPENMFYNTPLETFIWILSNRKNERRKGKIQLIDATAMKFPLRKNMGEKNCELTPEIRAEILRIFMDMEQSDVSMIFNNDEFAYWSITIERPLRLRVCPDRDIPAAVFKKAEERDAVQKALASVPADTPTDDWDAFAKATKLKAAVLKKIRPFVTEKDPAAKPVEGEADVDLRDTENVPFTYEGGVEAFMRNEVLTYAPDAYVDEKKTTVGYEISFAKYFYKPAQLCETADVLSRLGILEKELEKLKRSRMSRLMTEISETISQRETAVSWMKTIPAHWDEKSLIQFAEEQQIKNKGMVEDNLLSLSYGKIINKDIHATEGLLPASFEGYQIVHNGNIILRFTDLQNDHKSLRTGLVTQTGIITSAYTCLKTREGILPEYLQLQLHIADLCKVFYGMGGGVRQSIGFKDIRGLTIAIPPIEEQERILKRVHGIEETIRDAIEKHKAIITALEDLRNCLIADVVTGKADADADGRGEEEEGNVTLE